MNTRLTFVERGTNLTFIECDTCREKAGFIQLCNGCYHNRTAIHRAAKAIKESAAIDWSSITFMECDACDAIDLDLAPLCAGCRHNKTTIDLVRTQLAGKGATT